MRIIMLVNWKIQYCDVVPADKQPPDYCVKDKLYWFFRYFKEQPEVDVVDVSSFPWLEKFEKNTIRFYVWQALKVLPKLGKYDVIISHGMQSGVVLSLWRRLFKTKAKHIVFDIGSFNSAAESGAALKLMQFASKSIDGLIYHTGSQLDYYKKYFPWVVPKSQFIRFGTDLEFFDPSNLRESVDRDAYIICVGYAQRDWDTVVQAYQKLDTKVKLRPVGHVAEKYKNVSGVEQIPAVPIRELINQIYNARFAVLPLQPLNYSYGQMTLMQQMALGKCVIAAKVPSLVDYINEDTAVLYEPGNIDDLASKMEMILKDSAYCQKIAENGQKWLKNYCNEETMAKDIENFVRKVVKG